MNKNINFQFKTNALNQDLTPKISLDSKYGVYNSIEEAYEKVPIEQRNIGLTIGIKENDIIKEYWWQEGILDDNLIIKKDPYDIENLNEIDAYLQQQINQLHNVIFRIVEELPEIGETNVRYLIRNESGQGSNLYDEYIWIDNEQRFELYAAAGDIYITNSFNFDNTDFNVVEQNNVYNVSLNQLDSAIQNGLSLYHNASAKGLSFFDYGATQLSIYLRDSTIYIQNTYSSNGICFKTNTDVAHPNFLIKSKNIKYGILDSHYLHSFDLSRDGFKFTGNLYYNNSFYNASNIIFNYDRTTYNNDFVGSYPYMILESAAYDGSITSVKSKTELYTGIDNTVTIDNILNNTRSRTFYSSLVFDYEGNIQAIYGRNCILLNSNDGVNFNNSNYFKFTDIQDTNNNFIGYRAEFNKELIINANEITIRTNQGISITGYINIVCGDNQFDLTGTNINLSTDTGTLTLEGEDGIILNSNNGNITLNSNGNDIIVESDITFQNNIFASSNVHISQNGNLFLQNYNLIKVDGNPDDTIILISSKTAPSSAQECILKYDSTTGAMYQEIPQTSLSAQIAALEQRVAALEGNTPT